MFHSSGNSTIQNITGDLTIENLADDKDIIFRCDDGSGGVETYFFLDGNAGGANPTTIFPDDSRLAIGSGQDLKLYHSSGISYIDIANGNLTFRQTTDDGDIIFQCDDGSGGLTEYFRVDGSSENVLFSKLIKLSDNVELRVGDGNDIKIFSDGTDGYISGETGNLYIRQRGDDKDIIFQSDDGSGGVETYFFLDGSSSRTIFPDSKELVFGTSNNLFIFHGTHSYIQNYTSGDFYIDQRVDDKDIIFRADDGAGSTGEYFRLDGSAASHDGSATTASYTTWKDKSRIALGTSRDMQLYHDGTSSYIQNQTGNLTFRNFADDTDIIFETDDGSGGYTSYITLDGGDSAIKVGKELQINGDSRKLKIGASGDLEIYHDGTNSYIHNDTGDLNIECDTDDGSINLRADNGSGGLTTYLKIWGQYEVVQALKNMKVGDNVKFIAGDGVDLQIHHDGTDSKILC